MDEQARARRFLDGIKAASPLHAKFIDDAWGRLSAEDRRLAEEYLAHLARCGHDDDLLVRSYMTILVDTMDAQRHFLRTGCYPHASFAEVADSVYFNPDYMTRYMIGLALTAFLWPAHVAIRHFFQDALPSGREGTYLEIGPGHGLFLLHAMRQGAFRRFVGVDISRSSIELTRAAVRALHPVGEAALELCLADFLDGAALAGPYDMIVMGEVLEHVEQPGAFLRRIADLATPETLAFVSTCVNAPAIDHITLFPDLDTLDRLIDDSGLAVRSRLAVPHEGKTLEQCLRQRLPINVAYVLETK